MLEALIGKPEDLLPTVVAAMLIYPAIVLFIRVGGKRSTSQMNNFDWIVTVAIGSLASSGILLSEVSVADALAGMAVLMALQYVLTRAAFSSEWVARLVKAEPRLLFHDGKFLRAAMRRERVTEPEIMSKMREQGIADLCDVHSVVLETDASVSIITRHAHAKAGLETSLLGKLDAAE
ncbi:DUF421 domain-containing protein [Pyruvatibacter mobilis]|jgi:uncharacterized membrane protein YcaP (DUF421 family)|uniref:DUF421 domain-containing protein n=1 Tax=Pyruvatibacter mobilis TaxID=1712261 RepID=A0A845QE20_9HYPH|nr:YetF domain-containing protein [Pyruvatibacter mobilis]NBG96450.1 DUF421 domain-containing protein [Pyruvatibacter mobilis]QJD74652.1 DUF421 domain-containing protein [Pyruvatibacter mobilis]GGD09035.1 DUF421 domain-containing protein [Pyruvatibacter mobilis]